MTSEEVTPGISREEYKLRRKRFRDSLPDHSVTIVPSSTRKYMSLDVPYPYHADNDLFYLTGLMERGSVFVLEKGLEVDGHCVEKLFIKQKDESKEVWEGPSCGVEDDVRDYFAVDYVGDVGALSVEMQASLESAKTILYDPSLRSDINSQLMSVREEVRRLLPTKIAKLAPHLHLQQQRIIKSDAELTLMRRTCSIMAKSLNEAMASTSTKGISHAVAERHIEATIEYEAKMRGASKMAFPCVVASGKNGSVLHYMANDNVAKDGDMVMVDAGCQFYGYSSDVSRSWPVSGRFSPGQRALYELVLDVQERAIELATAKSTYKAKQMTMDVLHSFTVDELTQGLIDLGLIKNVTLQEAVERNLYFKYYPHAAGHYLGMDVHDTHDISKDVPLKPGMIVTIEPGLYVKSDDYQAPERFRGIGIRIEDNVAVGPEFSENLSSAAVKKINDIEHLVGSKS